MVLFISLFIFHALCSGTVEEHGNDRRPEEKIISLEERIKALEFKIKEMESRNEVSPHERSIKNQLKQIKEAIAAKSGGLQLSGFFDVNATDHSNNPNIFALGDFEFDMEHEIGNHFQIGAALVFNEETSELAVGFIDYHLHGGVISSRGQLFVEKGFHIQVGRFDIPFGNDWQFYASADRLNIFAPLTTERVIDGGYNDTGLRVLQATQSFNYSVHFLKGKKEGNSYGGRLGLTPFSNPFSLTEDHSLEFELGLSYIKDVGRDQNKEEEAWGVDTLMILGCFSVQAEYMRRESVIEDTDYSGYQFTTYISMKEQRFFVPTWVVRIDQAEISHSDHFSLDQKRVSLGLNMDFQEISMLKIEYLRDLDTNESQIHTQLVVKF